MKTSLAEYEALDAERMTLAGQPALNPLANKGDAVLRIAALSRNPETLKALRDYVTGEVGVSIQLQIWPGEAAHLAVMIEQENPDVLLLEGPGAREAELDVVESIVARHPDLTVILIGAQHSPELLLRALRIGIREVMQLPVSQEALAQVIGGIRRRAVSQRPQQQGKVMALLPCKGGAGATFLATNLACAIAAEGKRVCLIDLNFHFGEASLYVSEAKPASTVSDVLQQIQRLDGPLLESSMLRVTPNFWLLAAPDSPEAAVDIRPESIERLLNVARGHYDFVLLDVSRTLDANSIRALDHADDIYLVLQMTLPFLRDAARLLRLFQSLAYPEGRAHIVVNRFEKDGDISLKDLEQSLGVSVFKTVPNSFGAVAVSINQGRPIIEVSPQDPVSRSLREMARDFAEVTVAEKSWLQRLLKRKA